MNDGNWTEARLSGHRLAKTRRALRDVHVGCFTIENPGLRHDHGPTICVSISFTVCIDQMIALKFFDATVGYQLISFDGGGKPRFRNASNTHTITCENVAIWSKWRVAESSRKRLRPRVSLPFSDFPNCFTLQFEGNVSSRECFLTPGHTPLGEQSRGIVGWFIGRTRLMKSDSAENIYAWGLRNGGL